MKTITGKSLFAFLAIIATTIATAFWISPTHREAQRRFCVNNLMQIDGAKEQWARDTQRTNGSAPIIAEINRYIAGGHPKCPAGGAYTYGNLDEPPRCSIKSHTLPQ